MLNRAKWLPIVVFVACSAFGQSDGDQRGAQQHYRIALEALNDSNLAVASEELNRAAALAPSNALIRYYLGLVQSKQNAPAPALENVKLALSLGLPKKENDLADDLLVKLEYHIRKAEVDSTHATPQKLVGLYSGQIKSSDNQLGEWIDVTSDHDKKDSWRVNERTLSLNIVNESHITGFLRIRNIHTHEFRCLGSTGSHLNHKDITTTNDTQVEYLFVDISVSADGAVEGMQREVCYGLTSYGSMSCTDRAHSPESFKGSRAADGTLTFTFADGASRYYKKTVAVPSSVESWVSAPELSPCNGSQFFPA